MKHPANIFLILLMSLSLLSGCAGTPKKANFIPIQDLNAPSWIVKGSGAFGGERGDVFYGVSSAHGIKNISLLMAAADNRARNEVAKVFQFYTASLMKDYMASTMAGDIERTAEEQHVEEAIKTVTAMTLSGVQIVDHWQNPTTGEMYSLARLDLKEFSNNLKKAKELDARVRDYIRDNAKRLHEELQKEEDKLKERE